MEKSVPLQITAYLLDGRINSTSEVIMFDSILYHSWFCVHAPQVLDGIYDERIAKQLKVGLPLVQLPGNRWAASKGIYTEISQNVEYINKRPDFFASDKIDFLNSDKGIIDSKAGKFKAYRVPQIIRTLKDNKITFFAVGKKNKIISLLQYMMALGKKPAVGFGIVKKWEVKVIDADYTTEHPEFGLMCPIPVEEDVEKKYTDYPITMFATKPPYWKAKNMRLCYVPIKRK